jgi:folate-dependent phosphoribosylglycinamide formyltransferase PurN
MGERLRVGVLVSGNGSNLQALIDACRGGAVPAEIAVVISNVPTAFALQRARWRRTASSSCASPGSSASSHLDSPVRSPGVS